MPFERYPVGARDTGADWIDHEPLAVRKTIERIEGVDGRPLLFDGANGRYTAISPAGTAVLALMDDAPTARETVNRVSAASAADPALIEERVLQFLTELRAAEVFTIEAPPRSTRQRLLGFSLRQKMPRWALTRSVHRVLEPLAVPLRALPARPLVFLWLAGALGSLGLAGYTLVTHPAFHMSAWMWPVILLMVVQIACHELSHALVCQYLKTPVREAGITLLLFVMPVAYVDRTDSYRVRARGPRVLIALAGPLSDTFWAAAAAAVALAVPGRVGAAALLMLHFQLGLMIINLNPLLPSDGHHAIETAAGTINLRGRSFAYLMHLVTRAKLPSHLRNAGPRRRVGYLAYGLLCGAYGVGLAAIIVLSWLRLLALLVGA
jgi:putative peptide zinc metalloprotease protein